MPLWHLSRVSQCILHGVGRNTRLVKQTIPPNATRAWTWAIHSLVGQDFSLAVLGLLREGDATPALVVTRSHHAISPSLKSDRCTVADLHEAHLRRLRRYSHQLAYVLCGPAVCVHPERGHQACGMELHAYTL